MAAAQRRNRKIMMTPDELDEGIEFRALPFAEKSQSSGMYKGHKKRIEVYAKVPHAEPTALTHAPPLRTTCRNHE
ncbi:hypothetical protein [Streptomyces sp. NBC_00203]|uniref:hypothetical protein n=1 Tax=Streptomyces sp. NBC_00203 TaxID=2975680 RepID=UPI00324AFF4C